MRWEGTSYRGCLFVPVHFLPWQGGSFTPSSLRSSSRQGLVPPLRSTYDINSVAVLTARVPRLSLTLVHGSLRLTTLAQREPVLSVSVASPFHRHSLSTPLATLTAVTRVTKERRKHDGVREEPSKPWAGENGTVKETTIPYLSHPHHMVTARDERNEQGPHVMGSGLQFPSLVSRTTGRRAACE